MWHEKRTEVSLWDLSSPAPLHRLLSFYPMVSQLFKARRRCKRWQAFKGKWKINKKRGGEKHSQQFNKRSQRKQTARKHKAGYLIHVCTRVVFYLQDWHESRDPVSDVTSLYLLLQKDFLFNTPELIRPLPEQRYPQAAEACAPKCSSLMRGAGSKSKKIEPIAHRHAEGFPKGHFGYDLVGVTLLAKVVWRLWGPQTDDPRVGVGAAHPRKPQAQGRQIQGRPHIPEQRVGDLSGSSVPTTFLCGGKT